MTTALFAKAALLPEGWADNVRFEIDAAGDIAAIQRDANPDGAELSAGPVVPGMPNLHSHAFQRAMAGLAEEAAAIPGSFWSWREVMYRFAGQVGPEDVEAIASQLYVEMLKAGYTAVAEFHYLHHQPDGTPYGDPAELSRRVDAAARRAGIGLTHLPVLYRHAGFGGAAPDAGQRRFINPVDRLLDLIARLNGEWAGDGQRAIGLAPHSLRAVTPDELSTALAGLGAINPAAPIHIHIAEQTREVDECLAWSGARPVQWLLDHADVDARWCLVHATHLVAAEVEGIAAAQAVAGLCPSTEANLGDGLFPLEPFQALGGVWGIGSDSHVSVSAVEELRWLEYGQRLVTRRRNVAALPGQSTGAALWRRALAGGAQTSGRRIGRLAPGYRADLLVLTPDHPLTEGRAGDKLLDALVFAGNASVIADVMVGGVWRVRAGHHRHEAPIAATFRSTLRRLI